MIRQDSELAAAYAIPHQALRSGQREEQVSRPRPLLLYNDECGVCRRIAGWVARSAGSEEGEVTLDTRPIGDDPEALTQLDPNLDIWDACATLHLLMPDGSTKLGGEAVAEVLRCTR